MPSSSWPRPRAGRARRGSPGPRRGSASLCGGTRPRCWPGSPYRIRPGHRWRRWGRHPSPRRRRSRAGANCSYRNGSRAPAPAPRRSRVPWRIEASRSGTGLGGNDVGVGSRRTGGSGQPDSRTGRSREQTDRRSATQADSQTESSGLAAERGPCGDAPGSPVAGARERSPVIRVVQPIENSRGVTSPRRGSRSLPWLSFPRPSSAPSHTPDAISGDDPRDCRVYAR